MVPLSGFAKNETYKELPNQKNTLVNLMKKYLLI